ncbi:MAG: helix-turn-helix domain-containing protein [Oscillospiraceae bacterium]|nr:helix-turn-helix domain-containing protein [Ruminococcus sp.]MCD8345285.1 helix-turn-helix domain-containing protein [Oscillospiraceae bacterium]
MKEIETTIASNIIELRTRAGMTQLELAEKLNYSDKSVSKWERAEALPDVIVLRNIADIFGVTVDYLVRPHDPEEKISIVDSVKSTIPYQIIMAITAVGIFTVATILFIIFWLRGIIYWQVFVYALPVLMISLLVLNSIWHDGKYNFVIVSLLVLSIVATLYVVFLKHNWWQLFLIEIPAEALIVLSFRLFHVNHKKDE